MPSNHFVICIEREERNRDGDLQTLWDAWPVLDPSLEKARERYREIKGDDFFTNADHIYISEDTHGGLQIKTHPIE